MMHKRKIVVIGGGTGTYTILSGLKKYPNLELSAIISMTDSGGSNRVIRDEFGLLPTSDLRQCIVALASKNSNKILRRLFMYRYSKGVGISGMTFGNLFMAALSDIYHGDQEKAIEKTCEFLGVQGKIIPVTFDDTNLMATYSNGKQVLGEHNIDEPNLEQGKYKIIDLQVIPKAKVNNDAIKAIKLANFVILGPGDLYTSTLSGVVIDGIQKVLEDTKAKLIFVTNLMTRFGQTNGFQVSDFIKEVKKYCGRPPDIVVINNSKKFPSDILKKYKLEKSTPVIDDLMKNKIYPSMKVIRKDLVSDRVYLKPKSDVLIRSLVRHDSQKLAEAILDL